MIVYPAIDLMDGRAVQLEGGRPERVKVSQEDPAAIAKKWVEAGFQALHVVDLDAAFHRGNNEAWVERILERVEVPVQVGGGIAEDEEVKRWLDKGAARVIVGTRAVRDPEWLRRAANEHPEQVAVAADVREGQIAVSGWRRRVELSAEQYFEKLAELPLAAVIVTDVDREGSARGAAAERFRDLAKACKHPLIAAGGVGSAEDLRKLEETGVAGVIVGTALYTGQLEPAKVVAEFVS